MTVLESSWYEFPDKGEDKIRSPMVLHEIAMYDKIALRLKVAKYLFKCRFCY